MSASSDKPSSMSSAEPAGVFPLVRHISQRLTPLLVRLPVTANQITAASLVVGLGAAWAMTEGNQTWEVAGGVLLVLCYTLDNCDGEIARLKNQCTKFGGHFDTFVDWIVHTAIFAGLGYGAFQETGESLWLWLGLLAAAGGTLNYVIGIVIDVVGPGGGRRSWCRRRRRTSRATPKIEGVGGIRLPRTDPRRLLFYCPGARPLRRCLGVVAGRCDWGAGILACPVPAWCWRLSRVNGKDEAPCVFSRPFIS